MSLSSFIAKKRKSSSGLKFAKVMHEWGQNQLNNSSGQPVTDQKQAEAIAFSEQNRQNGNRT